MIEISAFNRVTLALAVCLIGSTVSCSADSTTSAPDVSGSQVIEQLTPRSVQATAGSTIDPAPAIRLTDKRSGQPLANVKVEFIPDFNAGYVQNPVTTTDASGVATAGRWVVGKHTSRAFLVARADGISSSFIADIKPDVPAKMGIYLPYTVGFAGELVDSIRVYVYDQYGNSTPGITVTFAISVGDGALSLSSGVTDASGGVTMGRWRLGLTPGENTVVASAQGIAQETFTVQGVDPTDITRFSLDSSRVGTQTRAPLQAGVSSGTLSITPFDQCLCRGESGYYILDVGYTNPQTVEPARISGKFRIDPPQVVVTAGPLMSLAIVNGRLELGVQRNDGEFIWTETWIFRKE